MKDKQVIELLDDIDMTVGAISDVVTLMLESNEGRGIPGAEVMHRLHKSLRSELDVLAVKHGLNPNSFLTSVK